MGLLSGIAWFIAFQIVGTVASNVLGIGLPGPIIGLLILLGYLMCVGHVNPSLETAAAHLLKYMPLLLVPAAVGVMAYSMVIAEQFWALLATLVLSLLPSMALCGWLMQRLVRKKEGNG